MYYHVRITQRSNRSHDETKLDLSEQQLRERFITPYERGEPIIINGKTIQPSDVERIRITRSTEDSRRLIAEAKAREAASSVAVIGGPSFEWIAASIADDVTDAIITGPPGYRGAETNPQPQSESSQVKPVQSSKKVFVVHGHDHALKSDIEVFLRDIGLEPVVLHREADGGRTVIEKFEHHSDVAYVNVLLTPDDVACSAREYSKSEADRKLEFRARQNVIFEFGFFAGRLSRRNVCCVYKTGVVLPSDLAGFIYKEVRDSIDEVAYALIKELQTAGLTITMRRH